MIILCIRCSRQILTKHFSTMVRLRVTPTAALIDEKIDVTVTGLRPLQPITIQASVVERSTRFVSCAQFTADQQGHVNTETHSSTGGTYTGMDKMGLFWSMKPALGQSKTKRLIKDDVTTPLVYHISLLDGHLNFEYLSETKDQLLSSQTCERRYMETSVRRVVVGEGKLRGTVFIPAGKGPFPGVVDMFGTAGGLIEMRAALLASRGFVIYALPYMMYDDLPKSVPDLDMRYFLDAVEWFSGQPYVHRGGVGVTGVSKGGELAFLLATYSNKVKAVVNISGSPVYAFADLKKDGKPFFKGARYDPTKLKHTTEGITSHDCFSDIKERIIPVHTSNAKVLYLCGSDDGTWDTVKHTETFRQLWPADKLRNLDITVFPGAGHLIEPPYMPLCRDSWSNFIREVIIWGGSPEAHAQAQEAAWHKTLNFLRTHLPHTEQLRSSL